MIVEKLKIVLASSYSLYLKTQNYHWNVSGSNFMGLHNLFEAQYSDLAEAIDQIAERINALGSRTPGSFESFAKLTKIQSANETDEANDIYMLKDLSNDQDIILHALNSALIAANEKKDEVTAHLLVERMSVHEKTKWILEKYSA